MKREHKGILDALALDHAGKLKEAVDGAKAAEAAKNELAGKVEKLELEMEELKKEISKLMKDRDMTIHTLADLQVTISDKTKLLSEAKNSITDLKLKLDTLEGTLAETRAHEKTLIKNLVDDK